jgi:hypothetical protein
MSAIQMTRRAEDLRLARHARASRSLRDVDWPLRSQSGPLPDLDRLRRLRIRRRRHWLRGTVPTGVLLFMAAVPVALLLGWWPWLLPLAAAVWAWLAFTYPG